MSSGAAVILAAGAGRRLGTVAKALLRVGERTFLDGIVEQLAAIGVAPSSVHVVVAAPFADEVAAAARARGCVVVVNPAPDVGMASSVACGFAALAALPDAVTWAWLWPVDHPTVAPSTLRALLAAHAPEFDAVIPTSHDRGGHPVVVGRALWSALAGCATAPTGARTVFASAHVRRLAVDDPAIVRDIDEPVDLARLQGACG